MERVKGGQSHKNRLRRASPTPPPLRRVRWIPIRRRAGACGSIGLPVRVAGCWCRATCPAGYRGCRRHGQRIKQTCVAPLAHRGGYSGHGTDDGGTDNEDKRWRRWKPTRRRKMRRGLGATRSCPMRAHMTASLASAHKDARLSWWLVFQCKKLAARADNRVLSIDKGAEQIQYFVDFRPQE